MDRQLLLKIPKCTNLHNPSGWKSETVEKCLSGGDLRSIQCKNCHMHIHKHMQSRTQNRTTAQNSTAVYNTTRGTTPTLGNSSFVASTNACIGNERITTKHDLK